MRGIRLFKISLLCVALAVWGLAISKVLKPESSRAPTATVVEPKSSRRIVRGRQTVPFKSSATATKALGVGTTATVTKPAGTVDGDVMIAIFSQSLNTGTSTPPAGWTLIDAQNGATSKRVSVYYKVASSEGANYVWTNDDSSVAIAVAILTFNGIDVTTTIQAHAKADSSSTTTPSAPSLTNATAGSILLCLFGGNGSSTWTSPAGMTERVDVNNGVATASVHELVLSATGATGAKQATASSLANTASFSVILNVAPVPAPTISGISPNSGHFPNQVVITGTDLMDATSVKFNNNVSASFTVNSATQITANVPPGAITGTISVTTPSGTATSSQSYGVTMASGFYKIYYPPSVGNVTASVVSGTGLALTTPQQGGAIASGIANAVTQEGSTGLMPLPARSPMLPQQISHRYASSLAGLDSAIASQGVRAQSFDVGGLAEPIWFSGESNELTFDGHVDGDNPNKSLKLTMATKLVAGAANTDHDTIKGYISGQPSTAFWNRIRARHIDGIHGMDADFYVSHGASAPLTSNNNVRAHEFNLSTVLSDQNYASRIKLMIAG